MSRFSPVFLLPVVLAACQSVPGPGWYNPDKPLSAFDYDFYSCRMMVLQTTPPAEAPLANAVYSQCYMYGNVQQCWQQQAPIYPNQNASPDPAWNAKVEGLTNECLARQGWTRRGGEPAAAGDGAAK
ncbi:hypothetical protein EZJ19_14730 [Parasulfuritortus cantonensis]|uniref:Lipoprotein n=1 Tax=Parasulfuritortus cantonensis TaxID=2528202 RepID=A0A4R1B5A9_9PROT|nr:hypothetical protein [Parasulfuritortus cantonensis]TCJ11667.1 hypothetical protein EZJ19_14730 [Parasulfuritortus cantonensis]